VPPIVRTFVLLAIAVAVLAGAGPAAAAVDPERNSTSVTGWWWYHGVSEATVNSAASSNGARVIDIEVESTSPYTFTAAYVKNSGSYARTWWWYFGLTSAQVTQKMNAHHARIIDLERYTSGGQRRFGVVMVKNTGSAAKGWWWYYDLTSGEVSAKLDAHNARLIDLESYVVNGHRRYSVVMIRNSGADAKAWWWYFNVSASFVTSKLSANKARLIDLDRRSNGNFDVVMQRRGSESWWWYYGKSASSVANLASQNGARIVDLEPYTSSGSKRFTVLMLNNSNAETSRLRKIMADGLTGSSYGVYVKKVGGGTVAGLQQSTIFEPASTIKVVHHLYTMRRIQLGLGGDTLSTPINYYVKPTDPTNKDVCPDPAWETDRANLVATTLQDALTKMMQNSDNRTTRAFQVRYGYPTINAYMDAIGMTSSEFRQILGCGFQNDLRNDLTLVDAGRLYEGVSNGTLLGGSARDSFWSIMLGGPVSATSALGLMIKDEGAKLGKSATKVNTFIGATNTRSKGGSYDICGSSCSSYTYIRTVAGRITIPFKNGAGSIVPTDYVYGRFADGLTIPCTPKSSSETTAQAEARCSKYKKANAALNKVGTEMFRTIVRAALKTW
jgi:hypothetical protein